MKEIFCQGTGPDMHRWLKKMIKQHGFGIMNVFDDHSDWFHYTVGNHSVGLPEILAIGGDQRTGGPLTDLAIIRSAAVDKGLDRGLDDRILLAIEQALQCFPLRLERAGKDLDRRQQPLLQPNKRQLCKRRLLRWQLRNAGSA